MYICEDCSEVFEEPKLLDLGLQDNRFPDANGNRLYEAVCPCCGSTGIQDSKPCLICGEPSLDGLCEMHKTEVNEEIDKLAVRLGIKPDDIDSVLDRARGW